MPAYNADSTLSRCLEALLAQETERDYEIILAVSADRAEKLPSLASLPSDPRLRVLASDCRVRAAINRNRAAVAALGNVLAFTDADVVVPPGWIEAMAGAATAAPTSCIAGAIVNGTPGSVPGTVEYLVEFLDVGPGRPAATAWHGATANLAMTRQAWLELGPFVEGLRGGEDTILTTAAARQGRFVFRSDITVTHLNRTTWRSVLSHHYAFGRNQAHLGRRSCIPRRALAHRTILAPFAGLLRFGSTYARLAAWGPARWRGVRAAPGVVLACAWYGAGLFMEGKRLDRGHGATAVL